MTILATVFKALSDETRLRIMNLLLYSGELCVCDIERVLGCTQTKVSRHLAYLRRIGLVSERRQGLWMLYSITKPHNNEQRDILDLLAGLLQSNEVAQKDVKRLGGNIRKGCCATYSLVKPKIIPSLIELTKN